MLNAQIQAGGVAVWGKAMPTSKGLSGFTYETEGTLKLSIDGRDPAYFYVYMTGLDNIDTEGTVRDGFGNATLTDIDGDNIHVKVDWFWDTQSLEDRGRFTLWSGSGKWNGVSGELDVVLKPTLSGEDDRFGAFLEGQGNVEFSN